MATETFYFFGTTYWAKVREPDEKYNNYQVPVYLNDKSWVQLRKSGLQLKTKKDDRGEYVTFRRDHVKMMKGEVVTLGPPEVFLYNVDTQIASPFDGLIGNGSEVIVQVDVYDTIKGKGHRLVGVGITKLVPYEKTVGERKFAPFA